jgi:hypothetical protein
MTQISRPFQIALVAVVLLAAVWFVALRGHSSSSGSSAPAPAASSPSTASSSGAAGSGSAAASSAASQSASGGGAASPGSTTYKGSAPGVDGLTRAIQKARGAVTESEQHNSALAQKSAQASSSTQAQSSSSAASQSAQASHGSSAAASGSASSGHSTTKHGASNGATKTHSSAKGAATTTPKSAAPKTTTKAPSNVPPMQARVEAELKQGKVAALLFWNPKGTVDETVRRELQSAAGKLHGKLAIHVARSSEVGSFGSFTRTVQVYGTPTILLINPQAKTASVTGLVDVFAIEQAVKEVKQAK